MGFRVLLNVFATTDRAQVLKALEQFYFEFASDSDFSWQEFIDVGGVEGPWVVARIRSGDGPEWIRERQLYVSKAIGCNGFLVFADDNFDGWGYEFFENGLVLDQFINNPNCCPYFSGVQAVGNADVVISRLPFLSRQRFTSYLVRLPLHDQNAYDQEARNDSPPNLDDLYGRWSGLAVMNFTRFLGISTIF